MPVSVSYFQFDLVDFSCIHIPKKREILFSLLHWFTAVNLTNHDEIRSVVRGHMMLHNLLLCHCGYVTSRVSVFRKEHTNTDDTVLN